MRSGWHTLAGFRLGVGFVAALIVAIGAASANSSAAVAVSAGWCALALVVCCWVWALIARKDAIATKQHARTVDFSRSAADLILIGASVASLVTVAFTLVQAGRAHGTTKVLLVALVVLTVTLAWASVHTVYAVRYGDLYYRDPVGGIDFNDKEQPDYLDFVYFALTIGMTFQVSDTDIQVKAVRRAAVRHALLSYLFGAVIIAVTINVVAGLLSK